ncbi:MAG: hypothetical protein FJ358_01540 [Thaumarchaeota archaeon]|nr:hypothetical protein [Nitrososphaerota archaeon]
MSSPAKIRLRIPSAEIEIEAPIEQLRDVIALLPDLLAQLPERAQVPKMQTKEQIEQPKTQKGDQEVMPAITLEKSDSLSEIIAKIFKESWGRKPRKLNQVREVLESYGLIYPKQSVAVTLLRLAQSGKLRRFKDEGGEFVYTASTSLSAQTEQSSLEIPLGA